MLSRPAMLLGGLLLAVATMIAAQRRGPEAAAQHQVHLVQSGPCSYTFVLPDPQPCPPGDPGSPDSLQRDVSPAVPSASLGAWRAQRVRQLEKALENSTLRLQKVSVATRDLGNLPTRGRSVTPGPSPGRDWDVRLREGRHGPEATQQGRRPQNRKAGSLPLCGFIHSVLSGTSLGPCHRASAPCAGVQQTQWGGQPLWVNRGEA